MVAREQLERQQGRAAARRALVVEPAAQQFLLRTPAELADRAEGGGPLTEVRGARRGLHLVGPLRAQIRELALGSRLRERVGAGGRLLQRHGRDFTYTRRAWPTESY